MAESENGSAAKILKTDAENECGDAGEISSDSPVADFEITRVLRDGAREKTIFIHGKVRVEKREQKSLWKITNYYQKSLTTIFYVTNACIFLVNQ